MTTSLPLHLRWLSQDMFFVDHNSGTTTYDDPRMVCEETLSSAERIAEQATSTHTEVFQEATARTDSTAVWKVIHLLSLP